MMNLLGFSSRVSALPSAILLALCALGAAERAAANPLPDAVAVREIGISPAGRYLVRFAEPGLADYDGALPGLARTAPLRMPFAARLDVRSPAARAYSAHLAAQRALHLEQIGRLLGRAVTPQFHYEVTHHGVSLPLSPQEAAAVAALPGIVSVAPVQVQQPLTYRGPTFIGADKLWDGSAVPAYAAATRGAGIRIGVIDTGADARHPSFANDPACGFDASRPKLVAHDCTASNGIVCTGTNPAPDPGVGHGMHVASTAAGNTLDAATVPTPILPAGGSMSGVAPCASVISYKVCGAGGCFSDALEAGVQAAVADAVDVANYSIGPTCGYGNPWVDHPDFRGAASTGVFVAAAAGNTDAGCLDPAGRVANLGPWVTTVAASTHEIAFVPALSVTGPVAPPALLTDMEVVPGSTTLSALDVGERLRSPLRSYAQNLRGCTAGGVIPDGYFNGAIAVVQRGDCNFSEKIINAAAAGADLVVVVNQQADPFRMDTTGAPETIGAFSITPLQTSQALLAFLAAHPEPVRPADAVFIDGFDPRAGSSGHFKPALQRAQQPDVIGNFSLRGPVPPPLQDLAKPDIAAPGVGIYAATDPASGDYQWLSGTSMASPHVAGSAALLRAIHPDWSVAEIKSALMTTTVTAGHLEDGITPWTPEEVGSGRVDLSRAALAGLTLDESMANYDAANPNGGSLRVHQLNLPSLRNMSCGERCQWTRTVRSRLTRSGTWTADFEHPAGYALSVEPASFTLTPGASQVLTITATVDDITVPAEKSFGRLLLREAGADVPVQQLPVAVRGNEVSVECSEGQCELRADQFVSGYSAVGCGTACSMLWANRYSPPAAVFPLTLTTITFLTGSSAYVHAGDRYDFYVYQDDDRDPANGATLVGSRKGYVIASAGARLRTLVLEQPIVLDGPGDIVIAMTNPSGTGPRPATGELSNFLGRSYAGAYTGEDPVLGSAAVHLQPTQAGVGSEVNWVIRAAGTTAAGRRIELGGTAAPATR
ncbi:S8 family serine peptidase [Tahibacter harae]|uniref:S8 family serine peptidase n=1 Tax=Tahibacter harae TaxID=2963937 RepID=A0ABT1QL63_9GAMM|nr:S8 family serine peptidase [Tahibacter harae]MCQ4163273.1 S8 family serine peptidase [Tahibacter harae]